MFDILLKVLQLNDMQRSHHMRGFFTSKAFTLLELLIVVSLIGIIAALLIPNINQARQEALRQVTRQQTKLLEKAVAAWFTAQPSIDAASKVWNTYDNAAGYISDSNFLTNVLGPYLSEDGASRFTMSPAYIITTPEMKLVPADLSLSSSERFIGGTTSYNSNITTAHAMLFWDSAAGKRANISPKTLLFLPNIKN